MERNNTIKLPELCLVLLMGASSSGKSTFARRLFKETEIVSSDRCRALVSDDENNLDATNDAFELARYLVEKRLKNALLTVIDATNLRPEDRKKWLDIAKVHHVLSTIIVLNPDEKICRERNKTRADRQLDNLVISNHVVQLKKSVRKLYEEGFRSVIELRTEEEMNAIEKIERNPLYNNKKHEHGPFDIIGDVHGCFAELKELVLQLGYVWNEQNEIFHPQNRKLVFVGDLVDRGPDSPAVLKFVMKAVEHGRAYCVPGNHDFKYLRYLNGAKVKLTHGLDKTVEQMEKEPDEVKEQVKKFLNGLISHLVFDNGKLAVAHGGLREEMIGRTSGAVKNFCMFGESTGEIDEFGLPVRYNWAADYKGKTMVVYGHTPVPRAQWLNNTIDIDTGCVFGGSLTALRYPEKELISVKAKEMYCEPKRPINFEQAQNVSLQHEQDDVLDISDFTGKQLISPRIGHSITIREENAVAALEVMSRFAVNPKWLIYLPPTMSPSETSILPDYLEYPQEAFDYFKSCGITKVICEEKHMGSRAVIVICKDEETAKKRFGIEGEGIGICYTRTGRNFFTNKEVENAFLKRLNASLINTFFYEEHKTDWVCLDCELMPWSAKAKELLRTQYAATGSAASSSVKDIIALLNASGDKEELRNLKERFTEKGEMVDSFITAYRNYCWEVQSLDDYKLAPFHILATEGQTWFKNDHVFQMNAIKRICEEDEGFLLATSYKVVDLNVEESASEAINWWLQLTEKGGEGMVVKPLNFIESNAKGLVQPAIKIRGREYLRIIYGAEYTAPEHMKRLKSRSLHSKRSLALREFALGVEALERFVELQPLREVHKCSFGILALESEPVDPRL